MARPSFVQPLIDQPPGRFHLENLERRTTVATTIEPAFDSATRKKGLLGRDTIPAGHALVIAPCSSVHTWFMRFPIDLVYAARDGRVVKVRRHVRPWRMSGALSAFAVIECAAGTIDRTGTDVGDTLACRDTFEPATSSGGAEAAAIVPSPGDRAEEPAEASGPIALSDVIGRQVPVAWYEAVAITQDAIAAALAIPRADHRTIPEPTEIRLGADGRVTFAGAGPTDASPVQRAGALLLALTPESVMPSGLRILALDAAACSPQYASLFELAIGLEFYERPDRRAVIGAVFHRARAAVAGPTPAEPAQVRLAMPSAPPSGPAWWRRRQPRVVAAVGVVLLLAGSPSIEAVRNSAGWLARESVAVVRDVWRVATDAADVTVYRLGFRRAEAAPPAAPPAPPAVARVPAPGPKPLAARPTFPAGADASVALTPSVSAGRASTSASDVLTPEVEPVVDPASTPEPAPPPEDRGIVYSASDEDVVPPALLQPRQAGGLTSGAPRATAAELELIVAPDGDVRSVKVVSSPGGVDLGMRLSVVKAWRFSPATLRGRPVTYRLRVHVVPS